MSASQPQRGTGPAYLSLFQNRQYPATGKPRFPQGNLSGSNRERIPLSASAASRGNDRPAQYGSQRRDGAIGQAAMRGVFSIKMPMDPLRPGSATPGLQAASIRAGGLSNTQW